MLFNLKISNMYCTIEYKILKTIDISVAIYGTESKALRGN